MPKPNKCTLVRVKTDDGRSMDFEFCIKGGEAIEENDFDESDFDDNY